VTKEDVFGDQAPGTEPGRLAMPGLSGLRPRGGCTRRGCTSEASPCPEPLRCRIAPSTLQPHGSAGRSRVSCDDQFRTACLPAGAPGSCGLMRKNTMRPVVSNMGVLQGRRGSGTDAVGCVRAGRCGRRRTTTTRTAVWARASTNRLRCKTFFIGGPATTRQSARDRSGEPSTACR
jgi:hypothetical protein